MRAMRKLAALLAATAVGLLLASPALATGVPTDVRSGSTIIALFS